MAWRDNMREASFRGAIFGVTEDSKQSGRRTIVHEFPQREEAYVEDMGMSNPRFTVQAFCLGPNYMDARDALEAELLKPGPGTLVHPWYGELTVSQAAPYTVLHSAENGGMCVFTLTFTLDGTPSSPSQAVNANLRAADKASLAGALAISAFDDAFSLMSQAEYVVSNAYSSVVDTVQTVQNIMSGDIGTISTVLGATTGYDFLQFASFGQRLYGVFEGIAESIPKTQEQKASQWLSVANAVQTPPHAENAGSMRTTIAANNETLTNFVRHVALVESAKAMALSEPESRNSAKVLRESFVDTLDMAMEMEPQNGAAMPPDLYTAFTEVRATTLNALAIAAKTAPEVINYTPATVLPAEVIAHRLTQDIALAPDLVRRNDILHPGFVPVEKLEVLL